MRMNGLEGMFMKRRVECVKKLSCFRINISLNQLPE